jgi:hypothetical protein
MRHSGQGAIEREPRCTMDRHPGPLCQIEQLPQAFVPGAFGDRDLIYFLATGAQGFKHGNQTVDLITSAGVVKGIIRIVVISGDKSRGCRFTVVAVQFRSIGFARSH